MRLKVPILLTAAVLAGLAADDLTRIVRRELPEQILARPQVARLPFFARDQLLLVVSPAYRAMPPAEAFRLLRKEEAANSASVNLTPLKPFIWYKGCASCNDAFRKGKQYLGAKYGPLSVMISVGRFEKYVDAWVLASLAKDASVEIDILASNVRFAEVRPRISSGERAPIKDVARAVQHGAGWKAALIGGFGGMATRTVDIQHAGDFNATYNDSQGFGSVSGNYSGRSTVTVPDWEARENARVRAQRLVQDAEARSAGVVNTALLDTTLRPGSIVDGFVYYRRDKGTTAGVLQIIVGTVSFEFPIEWR